jgi:hypothetical protein
VIPVIALYSVAFFQITVAAQGIDTCSLPPDLQREVATKYPGTRLVALPDLAEDDKGFFLKDHGNSCPGLVKVDFYGDGKLTLAFVLFTKSGPNQHTDLFVAHKVGEGWKIARLDTGGPNAPAVWSQPPGEYKDIYGNKTIRATHPVIVFCKYESWAILYAWSGSRVAKIWLSD